MLRGRPRPPEPALRGADVMALSDPERPLESAPLRAIAEAKSDKNVKRTVTAGTLSFTGHKGTNKVVFQGSISRARKLKPGARGWIATARLVTVITRVWVYATPTLAEASVRSLVGRHAWKSSGAGLRSTPGETPASVETGATGVKPSFDTGSGSGRGHACLQGLRARALELWTA
jgi:hypothetical protein